VKSDDVASGSIRLGILENMYLAVGISTIGQFIAEIWLGPVFSTWKEAIFYHLESYDVGYCCKWFQWISYPYKYGSSRLNCEASSFQYQDLSSPCIFHLENGHIYISSHQLMSSIIANGSIG